MTAGLGQQFRVGAWRADASRNVLSKDGSDIVIEPRLMRLLVHLAQHAGKVLAREDLLAAVWPGRAPSDESLARAVSALRGVLGDDPADPTYVETIRKKGYRLVAEVGLLEGDAKAGRTLSVARPVAISLLAVAAFATVLAVGVWVANRSPASDAVLPLLARPVTRRPGRERDPDLSADGRYVVYSAEDADGNGQIFLHGVDRGTGDRRLTVRHDNRSPVFSGGGDNVLFLRRSGDRCTVIDLTLIDGAERVVGDCSGNGYADLAMSPNDRLLAFNARAANDEAYGIVVMDTTNGRKRQVTTPPVDTWGDFDPVFDGNGRLVFARAMSEGLQDLYSIGLDGGPAERLTHDARNIFGLDAVGGCIVYSTNASGRFDLRIMCGGEVRRLPVNVAGIVNPSLAANGSLLVFEVLEKATTLQRIDPANGTEPRELLSMNADLLHPDIAPNGDTLAFSSNRSGHYEIWTADSEGSVLAQLTRFGNGFTAHPRYSPDGEQIAFDARPDGYAAVYLMRSGGSNALALTPPGVDAYAPSWSTDGRYVYFASNETGELQLWRADVTTGERRQVTEAGGAYGVVDETGALLHTRPGLTGLWRLKGDGEPERIATNLDAGDWGNWVLRGRSVLYYDRAGAAIRALELDKGTDSVVISIAGNLPVNDPMLAVDPAGRIYLGIRSRLESDIDMTIEPLAGQ